MKSSHCCKCFPALREYTASITDHSSMAFWRGSLTRRNSLCLASLSQRSQSSVVTSSGQNKRIRSPDCSETCFHIKLKCSKVKETRCEESALTSVTENNRFAHRASMGITKVGNGELSLIVWGDHLTSEITVLAESASMSAQ